MALLAFLAAGHTHLSKAEHRGLNFGRVVAKGLTRLMAGQDPEGCLADRKNSKYMYDHAIAALALVEAYGMTRAPKLEAPARKSNDFLIASQNPGKAWRYAPRSGDSDTSVTSWSTLALKSAQWSGLSVPRTSYDGVRRWLDEVTEENYYRVGYTAKGDGKVFVDAKGKTSVLVIPPPSLPRAGEPVPPDPAPEVPPDAVNASFQHHESLTAAAVAMRLFIDADTRDGRLKVDDLMTRDLPKWDGLEIDFHYWHFGSTALFQREGPHGKLWKKWDEAARGALLEHQNASSTGCKGGSWEPVDRWSSEGGRVYATALNTLTLLTSSRYLRSVSDR